LKVWLKGPGDSTSPPQIPWLVSSDRVVVNAPVVAIWVPLKPLGQMDVGQVNTPKDVVLKLLEKTTTNKITTTTTTKKEQQQTKNNNKQKTTKTIDR